jgi:hypothetical protein
MVWGREKGRERERQKVREREKYCKWDSESAWWIQNVRTLFCNDRVPWIASHSWGIHEYKYTSGINSAGAAAIELKGLVKRAKAVTTEMSPCLASSWPLVSCIWALITMLLTGGRLCVAGRRLNGENADVDAIISSTKAVLYSIILELSFRRYSENLCGIWPGFFF